MSADLHEMTMKDVFARTMVEIGEANPQVVMLEADLGVASGSLAFGARFPERFVEIGVAEANMIGVAAGLAADGKIPFCCSFTPFATRRAYDQITVSVAYADNNVKIVGIAPGITTGVNGGTHMCFQDLAIMRAMPNMTVLSPADAYELKACLRWMAATPGPVYMQYIRSKRKPLRLGEHEFVPGRAVRLRDGSDVTLLSTGYMTQFAVAAAIELADEGIHADLLHCPCVKPFPEDDLVESAGRTGRVVVVETQNIIGGLGGAAAEVLSDRCPVRVKRLGIPDRFGEVFHDDEYMFDKHGFGPKHVVSACRDLVGNGKGGTQ